ncbi:glycogen debranching protein GlgX [Kosakonia cowanii]|uniref:glycogen debranching protein GlgX n=1 Tax=Kosakonia cowanii TaxID=208223 RepID=UPI001123E57B|nr:glycogen debranching protein GlgX [Kosakonia cowanii]MDP9770102.1 glycogen operon protein [Atlantibacter hermannii]TPD61310.1 glycogen debranching protein GlgX [Kosakonia cowanii]TPD85271.1 glycogen debranching protein GlgX [Kosakonia cowanii]TPE02494.1 glycogen debranching protein GlgX [Kosakonia cowanii]
MISLTAGSASPLGAEVQSGGVNFSLFSAHAERVELCLFDAEGNEQRVDLPVRTGDIWHGFLPGAKAGQRYGYRVHGPWQPAQGHRFNPAKLLLDPCARRVEGEAIDSPLFHAGFDQPDPHDSAPLGLRSVVVNDAFNWEADKAPRTPWGNSVIYEAHVKGLTWLHPDIPQEIRGTYKALAHPVMIAWFKQLGITALELLPIAHFAHEQRLQRLGLSNYWGYNPLALFALHPAYAHDPEQAINEFRAAVKALHAAGIEVILDIVLNHSAETDLAGPTFSQRGIDNRSYYWIREDGDYHNWTGCGNTLNLSQPGVVEYAHACLRYWVETFHIDGFRFDLAPVMGRTPEFNPQAPLFAAIQNDPLLRDLKLIAEPWDIGEGGYQVGNFPAPFAEWNDHFRDAARRFWLTESLPMGAFAGRFAASSDLFKRNGRLPSATVNLVTAHDGFTLRDCVSFDHKHNQANGEDNRDGTNDNHSFNHGVEGLDASADVMARRRASQHALLATLLLSQGTPMLLAGDEMGHSQHGNNNAYCQDNALTWLDWRQADHGLIDFTAALIKARSHIAALTDDAWWEEGDGNVAWLNQHGRPLTPQEWQEGAPRLQILLSNNYLLVMNATSELAEIALPTGDWHALSPFAGEENPVVITVWQAPKHGVCLFQRSDKRSQSW